MMDGALQIVSKSAPWVRSLVVAAVLCAPFFLLGQALPPLVSQPTMAVCLPSRVAFNGMAPIKNCFLAPPPGPPALFFSRKFLSAIRCSTWAPEILVLSFRHVWRLRLATAASTNVSYLIDVYTGSEICHRRTRVFLARALNRGIRTRVSPKLVYSDVASSPVRRALRLPWRWPRADCVPPAGRVCATAYTCWPAATGVARFSTPASSSARQRRQYDTPPPGLGWLLSPARYISAIDAQSRTAAASIVPSLRFFGSCELAFHVCVYRASGPFFFFSKGRIDERDYLSGLRRMHARVARHEARDGGAVGDNAIRVSEHKARLCFLRHERGPMTLPPPRVLGAQCLPLIQPRDAAIAALLPAVCAHP
ncbi:hypothetical protein MRX96_030653 [Rhipicephalus microplus]